VARRRSALAVLFCAKLWKNGISRYPKEWWHFDYQDWKQYPILNMKFEELGQ
jgi:zinc D-Ala-D-Ala dipeptidase